MAPHRIPGANACFPDRVSSSDTMKRRTSSSGLLAVRVSVVQLDPCAAQTAGTKSKRTLSGPVSPAVRSFPSVLGRTGLRSGLPGMSMRCLRQPSGSVSRFCTAFRDPGIVFSATHFCLPPLCGRTASGRSNAIGTARLSKKPRRVCAAGAKQVQIHVPRRACTSRKVRCAERASNCPPKADRRGAECSEAFCQGSPQGLP